MRLGYFKEFVLEFRGGETKQIARPRGNTFPPPLGVIEVIHVASMGTFVTQRKRVLTMVPTEATEKNNTQRRS